MMGGKARILLCAYLLLMPQAESGNFRLPRAAAPAKASSGRAGGPRTTAPASLKTASLPFDVGETLNYRVAWASFTTAASLQVSVPERRNLFGWPTWHFRAALHTENSVRALFAIDDEFDSYADTVALDTRRYEAYQSELGRKQVRALDFLAAGQKPWGPGPDAIVLAGTRDPVGALYALRDVDWQRTPEFRVPVYDGNDIYQLSARLEAKNDSVSVAAGTFTTSRVGVNLSQGTRQTPQITFKLWLSNDRSRTPVQFQASLPFGSIHAELLAYQSSTAQRSER